MQSAKLHVFYYFTGFINWAALQTCIFLRSSQYYTRENIRTLYLQKVYWISLPVICKLLLLIAYECFSKKTLTPFFTFPLLVRDSVSCCTSPTFLHLNTFSFQYSQNHLKEIQTFQGTQKSDNSSAYKTDFSI